MKRPKADRPHMPGYGIVSLKEGSVLPWSWAAERLGKAHNYFISTTRPDGRPHTMVIWGVWVGGMFYFSTGRESRKSRNLVANPWCVICPENAAETVILEGTVKEVKVSRVRSAASAYFAKYKWKLDPKLGPIYAVRPRVVFGFIEADEAFPKTATRWTF